MNQRPCIRIEGARQHNLKNITVEFPRGALSVITGPSGSGKSSLAFDTIYAEGQRRYVESLSTYARQFLDRMPRPDVDRIEGLSPTLAIAQRVTAAGPRSTVATVTEIHDFLRVLFARVGEPRCPKCDRLIVRQSTSQVVESVLRGPQGQRIMILAPLISQQRGVHKAILDRLVKEGFVRARIDGKVIALEEAPQLAAARQHTIEAVVDRLSIKPEIARRLADSVETAVRLSGGRVVIAAETADGRWSDEAYSAALACPEHPDMRIDDLSPTLFSFNAPQGACPKCHGLGTTLEFDPDLIVPDQNLSLGEGAIAAWRHQGRRLRELYSQLLEEFCLRFAVRKDIPFRNIPEPLAHILIHGTNEVEVQQFGVSFEGAMPSLMRLWESTESGAARQRMHSFLGESPCADCKGARLRPEALSVKLAGRNIAELCAQTIGSAAQLFEEYKPSQDSAKIAGPLLGEIRHRLQFLCDVGVEYLTLDRAGDSLAGGEWQRIRLATQIGSGLTGVCYVLDEPTIGLHARDRRRLAGILKRLAELDNTVIVVEHDEEVISAADYLVDIGPGAGPHGGSILAAGAPREVLASKTSITAQYLSGEQRIPIPEERRGIDWSRSIELFGVTANNLKNIRVRFPLGCLVCVTGVSGSGKSTLVDDVLLRAARRRITRGGPRPGPFERISGVSLVDSVIQVDQSPLGRSARSNPATYVGAFDLIRRLFAETREAKIRGYGTHRFSFNVRGGRCEQCQGQGVRRIAMHFLPDVFVTCRECSGTRYNNETLEVRLRGKTIADVLSMLVDEAARFFENFPRIRERLQGLRDVGLGYISLGQSSSTLSGGEAQRVKLASELHRVSDSHTLYVLDEPTTGLHFSDIRNLLSVLTRLVDRGHTVLIIEHNLEVIKVADWIIDLGPEGGEAGGYIVAEGTPEQVATCPQSHTGRFLKHYLLGKPPLRAHAST